MTENGDPREKDIAERVNGILKTEWIYDMKLKTKEEVKEEVNRIINIYNINRPHCSLDMLTPEQAHSHSGKLKKHWKNYWQKKQEISTEEKSLVL